MERRGFIQRLFGTAAAVVVAPSVFTEETVAEPVVVEAVKKQPPYLGLGLVAEMEKRANHYTIIGNERLINILDDLMAEDPKPTFFGTSFKPLKSKYHK